MKTLLIIAYYFAPAAVVGTHRILRFVRYLPSQGWHSLVVTVKESHYDLIDQSLASKVDGCCTVYRTRLLEFFKPERIYSETKHGGVMEAGLARGTHNRSIRRLLRRVTALPDTKVGWIPFAVAQSLVISRSRKFDAILTTSFPYSAHLVGLVLKRTTGKPWIVDLRDPWAEYAFLYPGTAYSRRAASRMEARVVQAADVVIANTPAARDRMHIRYPQHAAKIVAIPNGFEPSDFAGLTCAPDTADEKFTIVHTGTLFPQENRRHPLTFLRGLAELLIKRPELRDRFVVRFVGHTHHRIELARLADSLGLRANVITVGYVDHDSCMEELLAANLLLLIHHSEEPIPRLFTTVPAKTYEYLAARKPILCLSSEGAVVELIANLQVGRCADPSNVHAVCHALQDIYDNYETWAARVNHADISQYDARELTQQLVSILDKLERSPASASMSSRILVKEGGQ